LDRLQFVLKYLKESFFEISSQLPVSFCHGDFHVLNIIWDERDLKRVIDWEFCGFKPELYDVANMVGCLGIEEPNCLVGPLIKMFIRSVRAESGETFACESSWKYLHELIVANRFAWLSEWLRKGDQEMVDLELTYLRLLIDYREEIIRSWEI